MIATTDSVYLVPYTVNQLKMYLNSSSWEKRIKAAVLYQTMKVTTDIR
jgi:hypothetical protein